MRNRPRFPLVFFVIGVVALAVAVELASPPPQTAQAPAPAAPKADGLTGAVRETQSGLAAYYNQKLHGRRTASRARFDNGAMTPPHQSLRSGRKERLTSARQREGEEQQGT